MQIPTQVAFRGIPVSDAVEAACLEQADRLERFFDRITSCRVVVAEPHRRHRKGNLYDVRIHLTVPGDDLVVTREPPEHHTDEDVYVALREAFDSVRRQLERHVDKIRGDVKMHEPRLNGTPAPPA